MQKVYKMNPYVKSGITELKSWFYPFLNGMLFLLMIGTLETVTAQNIRKETIQWNAIEFTDLSSNEVITRPCKFVTTTNKLKWIQDDGKYVVEFDITSKKGSWLNVTLPGSIEYGILDRQVNIKGEVKIRKETQAWIIELKLTGGSREVDLKYTISSIEKL